MIENKQGITEIIMTPSVICKCAIGQDWYTNNFTITFVPKNHYPDYMEVDEWLNENLRGRELNIEDAVEQMGKYLLRYEPLSLTVETEVKDVLTHFPVKVKKIYQ